MYIFTRVSAYCTPNNRDQSHASTNRAHLYNNVVILHPQLQRTTPCTNKQCTSSQEYWHAAPPITKISPMHQQTMHTFTRLSSSCTPNRKGQSHTSTNHVHLYNNTVILHPQLQRPTPCIHKPCTSLQEYNHIARPNTQADTRTEGGDPRYTQEHPT